MNTPSVEVCLGGKGGQGKEVIGTGRKETAKRDGKETKSATPMYTVIPIQQHSNTVSCSKK